MDEQQYVPVNSVVEGFEQVRIWKHDPNISHQETIHNHAVAAYEYEGRSYSVTLPYDSNDNYSVGDEVLIHVLASDPTHVRETELLRNEGFLDIILISLTIFIFYILYRRLDVFRRFLGKGT